MRPRLALVVVILLPIVPAALFLFWPAAPPPHCTPLAVEACTCATGGEGEHTCTRDGSGFGPCTRCTEPPADADEGHVTATCCNALRDLAGTAPLEQRGGYAATAALCDGVRETMGKAKLKKNLAHFLPGRELPDACR